MGEIKEDVAILTEPKTGLEGIPFEVILKAERVEDEAGDWIVEGYAATSDLDLQGDVIMPEALEKAAEGAVGLTVLYNHDPDQAVGKIVAANAQEGRGGQGRLWVRVEVSKAEPKIWSKVKQGVINKFSIRGKILRAHHDQSAGREANVIEEFVLLEISLVAVPANPEAKTLRAYVTKAVEEFVKSGGIIPALEDTSPPSESGGQTEETAMEKTVAEGYVELCAEKGVVPFAEVEIAEDMSEEDVAKVLAEVHEARVAVWKELRKEEDYPYPEPTRAKKPAAAPDAKKLKELAGKLMAGLKGQMALVDELGKFAGPSPEPAPKAGGDDDKGDVEPEKDEKKDAGEPEKAAPDKDEVEALKEVAKQLNARVAELEKASGDKYTFKQMAEIFAATLQKK